MSEQVSQNGLEDLQPKEEIIEEATQSDEELEEALRDPDTMSQPSISTLRPQSSWTPSSALPPQSASTSSSPQNSFKIPGNPSIPQDLSMIAEMVSQHQVVGALPKLSITAAEKRRLVEESMRKGKARAVNPPLNETPTIVKSEQMDQVSQNIEYIDSDSSSEFLSDEEAEEEDQLKLDISETPMTQDEHAELKSQLDKLVQGHQAANGDEEDDGESDTSSEYITEDDENPEFELDNSPLQSPVLKTGMRLEEIDDDDDDLRTGGPIASLHEKPLPPVAQPPIQRLPESEKLCLAGDVVSWMRDKQVEAWLEKERVGAEKVEEEERGVKVEETVVKVEDEAMVIPPQPEIVISERSMMEEGEIQTVYEEVAKTEEVKMEEAEPIESTIVSSIPLIEETKPSITLEENTAAVSQEIPVSPTKRRRLSKTTPRFSSAGTVVLRAMQETPGLEGWLEEGSVLCWKDGRVLGTVGDTFGPLTSPFYTIRLPPPPYPYPLPSDLSTGTKIYYPQNPLYRSFVNMNAVRDPRFKGTDASNMHDEEIGEDELEFYSDDEAEAEARRRKKGSKVQQQQNKRGLAVGGGISHRGGSSRGGFGLPARPHFDYQPSDDGMSMGGGDGESVDGGEGGGSMYGDHDGLEETFSETGSIAGSSVSIGRRPMPEPYDDVDMAFGHAGELERERPRQIGREGGSRGGRGNSDNNRGRGQGRQRGRGRGGHGDQNRAGRGRGRGNRGGQAGQANSQGRGSGHGQGHGNGQGHSFLPPRPMEMPPSPQASYNFNQQPLQHQQSQQPQYHFDQSNGSYSNPQPFQSFQNHHHQQHQHQHQQTPQFQQFNQTPMPQQSFSPMGFMPTQTWVPPMPITDHAGGGNNGPGVPVINPRFAAQYSQMFQPSPENSWQSNQGGQGYSE